MKKNVMLKHTIIMILMFVVIFILWKSPLNMVTLSNVTFILGALYLIVGIFQVTVDLKFYHLAVRGTKRLVKIILGKNVLARRENSDKSVISQEVIFANKVLYLAMGISMWIISLIATI